MPYRPPTKSETVCTSIIWRWIQTNINPREINAAARENSRGGRPRETFRPARLFLHPRETFSSRKRVASLEDKREHVPSKCLIVKEASENSAAARARNPMRRFRENFDAAIPRETLPHV